MRFFSKKYENVFWHELAHLILHSKKQINDYISHDLREFEAEFFVYSINFFAKDIQNETTFKSLLSKLHKISKKEIKNYTLYYTFLINYSNNNINFMGYKNDLAEQTFYENKYIKYQ